MRAKLFKNFNLFSVFLGGILILATLFFSVPKAEAAITKEINYQGRMTNLSDVNVSDAGYSIIFRIYDAPTGGTCLWSARGTCGSPTARTVTTSGGLFSIGLGDTAAGDNAINLDWNETYYLGVKIGADTEMSPRKKISASGYAFNSDLLDGLDSATYGATAHILATNASGDLAVSGNVGVGISSPLSKLHISGGTGALSTGLAFGDGDSGIFENSDDELYIAAGGNNRWKIDGSYLGSLATSGARMIYGAASDAVPGFAFTGDENTGLGRANADVLSLIAGGVNGLNLNSSGNVGIGTTSPNVRLEVVGGDIRLSDGNNLQWGGANNYITGSGSSNYLAFGTSGAQRMSIYSNGSVAIGTSDPIGRLDIGGGSTSAGTALGDAYLTEVAGYINSPYVSFGEYQNYLLQTEAFATTWAVTNLAAITSNNAISPDGTLIAENIPAETTKDGTGQIYQTVTEATTGDWTFSVWLKAQSGTANINLRIDSNAETGTSKAIVLTTAWKRYFVTQNLTTAHANKTVRILNGDNAIVAWGAQLEQGSRARVYGGAQTTSSVTALTRTLRLRGSVNINGTLTGATTGAFSGAITGTVPTLYVSTDGIVQTAAASTGVTGTLVPLDLSPRIRQIGQAWDIDGAANVLNNYWQEVIAYPGNTVGSKLAWYYSQGAMATAAEYQAPEIMNYYNGSLNVLGSTYGAESLTNGVLTSGTSWSVANGFSLASNTAVYVHNASGGTLTQASANFAVPVKANRWYRFTWTSSAVNTTARAYIDPTGISRERVYLRGTVVTPGTYTTTFKTNASPGDFIITADSAAAGDGFTLDGLSLVEIQSGDIIANGLFTGGGTSGMKIDNVGNVGIGTTAPGSMLEVAGQIKITGGSPAAGYVLTSDANGLATWGDISSSGGAWTLSGNNLYPDNTAYNIAVGATDAGTAKLYVNGNVGIGTTGPGYKLHVYDASSKGLNLDASVGNSVLDYSYQGAVKATSFWDATNNVFKLRTTGANSLYLGTNGTQRFEIDGTGNFNVNSGQWYVQQSSGNIGIGTTAPTQRLDVAGNSVVSQTYGTDTITDGTFSVSGIPNWTLGAGWADGTGTATKNADGTGTLSQAQSGLTTSRWYKLTYTINSISGGSIRANLDTTVYGTSRSTTGTFTEYVHCNSATNTLSFVPSVTGVRAVIDNVSLQLESNNYLSWQQAGKTYTFRNDMSGYSSFAGIFADGSVTSLLFASLEGSTYTISSGGTMRGYSAAEYARTSNYWTPIVNTSSSVIKLWSEKIGVNTTSTDADLEINNATGGKIRLTHNDFDGSAATYADLQVNSGGNLVITPSGGNIGIGTTGPGATLAIKSANALSGDPALEAGGIGFGNNGMIFEGATADTFENYLTLADPATADRTWTLPNVTGAIVTTGDTGTVTGTMTAANTLDFTDFEDTLDLDANFILNQAAYTWTQNFTGNTTTGMTYNANSLSSGLAFYVASTSTALTSGGLFSVYATGAPAGSWTGDLAKIEYNNADVDVDGTALKVGILGAAAGDGTALNVTTGQTGTSSFALRVNDDGTYADTTPFVVDRDGNVGIGTTGPRLKLDVNGPILTEGGTYTSEAETKTDVAMVSQWGQYYYAETSSGNLRRIIGVDNSSYANLDIGAAGTALIASINLRAGNAGYISMVPGGGEAMRITSTGNVGIGTTSPGAKLAISSSGGTEIQLISTDTGTVPQMSFYENSTQLGGFFQYRGSTASTPKTFRIGTFISGGQTQLMYGVGSIGMTLDNNGNVGIGTTAPGAALEVNGDIIPTVNDNNYLGGTGKRWYRLRIGTGGVEAGADLNFSSGSVANGMVMKATSGNVGIGTTGPGSKLEVAGAMTVSGSNLTTLGGNLTVTGTAWTATPTISGLITATGGVTSNGTLTANGAVTLGDNGDNVTINSNVWDITGAGVASGLTGLASTGTIAFSGAGTFSIDSSAFDVSTTGALSGITTIGMSGQLTSTLATGTAPLAVTSTTVNTNLNADLLDGYNTSMVAGNSTVVVRNASGYVLANYFNTTADVTATAASHFAIQTATDSYIRWQTPANARTSLGLVAAGAGDIWVEKAGDTMSGDLTFNNYGLGIVGTYSATAYQNVFSMGASYTPADSGATLDSMYGIAWTHSNIGDQSKAGLAHQALFVNAGTTQTAIGTGIWTLGGYTQSGTSANTITGTSTFSNATYSALFTGGNVGVGTASPGAKLDVVNSASGSIALFKGGADDTSYEWSGYYSGTTRQGIMLWDGAWAGCNNLTDEFCLAAENSNYLTLHSTTGIRLTGGNVGIGTVSPTQKLTVAGTGDVRINITSPTASGATTLEFVNDAGSISGAVFQAGSTYTGYGGPNSVNLLNVLNAPLTLGVNNYVQMTIASSGNVGIGTTNPYQKLQVAGRIRMDTWTADGDAVAYQDTATNSIALAASDRRLKKNIVPLNGALDIINQINAYKYNDLDEADGSKLRLGFMSQELLPIIPELTFKFSKEGSSETYYGVHYDKMTALLLQAMKEQQVQINDISASTGGLQSSLTAQELEMQKLSSALSALKLDSADKDLLAQQKIETLQNNLNFGGSQINLLSGKLSAVSQKMSQNFQAELELPFYQFTDESSELSSTLTDGVVSDGQFSGNYTSPENFQELTLNLTIANQIDLSDKDLTQSYLVYDVFIEDPNSIEDYHTEIGNTQDTKEIEWNKPAHPYFMPGWNEVKLSLADGVKSGEIDWQNLSYFRAYFKFRANNQLKFRNIRIETKATYQPLAETVGTDNLDLWNNADQGTALKNIFSTLDKVETQNLASLQVSTQLAKDLEAMQDQLTLLQDQTKAVMDFSLAMNLENVIYKDTAGSVLGLNIIEAQEVKAKKVEAQDYVVSENVDPLKNNVGSVIIKTGEQEVLIKNSSVTIDSKIIVTPVGSSPVFWVISDKINGVGFKIKLDKPAEFDIAFDYWVIGVEK